MPRGAPDYSNVWSSSPLHRLDDMAEMAARLGSPNVYDRGGYTIWMTDFESGLQGAWVGGDHEDSKATISSARAFHGNFSLKLDPRGVDESYIRWFRVIHYFEAGNIGIEFALSLDSHPERVKCYAFYHDETEIAEASLHYWPEAGLWKIRPENAGWETILEDFQLQTGPAAWHPIKIVLDFDKKEYVRVQIARHVINLPGRTIPTYSPPDAGQLEVRLEVDGSESEHASVYVDGVIITQGEP